MKDGIIKRTGNSRYLKSALTGIDTWEDFKAALLAGTLPIDLNGINGAGWQQIGTAINKANLLSDASCALLNISTDSVPDDAFTKLALGDGKYGYKVTIQMPDGTPLPGVTIQGLTGISGGTCVTGEDGVVLGVSASSNVSLTFTNPYIDLTISSVTVKSTSPITLVTVQAVLNGLTSKIITSSTTIRLSPSVSFIDFACVGGGGGGSNGGGTTASGGGGGGGYLATKINYAHTNIDNYSVLVGGGGNAGSNGSAGGTTSVKIGSATLIAASGGNGGHGDSNNGGAGGAGNGNGGAGEYYQGGAYGNGGSAFQTSSMITCGGGGGGARRAEPNTTSPYAGGSPYGGHGAYSDDAWMKAASSGTGYGGGGGGGNYNNAGSGFRGAVALEWRYAS